jgi:hypothetical protein
MRTGQALAGVATISLLHERGMSHSGLRNGYLALSPGFSSGVGS